MIIVHDVYLNAYRAGGLKAVNDLLMKQFPAVGDHLRAMQDLEDTGLWKVGWHTTKRESLEQRDFGVVTAYLGD
jgi:hypothetical protein